MSTILTERESQILKFIIEGKQTKIIAYELSISEHTVKVYIRRLMCKTGLHKRSHLVLAYNDVLSTIEEKYTPVLEEHLAKLLVQT